MDAFVDPDGNVNESDCLPLGGNGKTEYMNCTHFPHVTLPLYSSPKAEDGEGGDQCIFSFHTWGHTCTHISVAYESSSPSSFPLYAHSRS